MKASKAGRIGHKISKVLYVPDVLAANSYADTKEARAEPEDACKRFLQTRGIYGRIDVPLQNFDTARKK